MAGGRIRAVAGAAKPRPRPDLLSGADGASATAAPDTSAPVDHASRTGWGRTVRKPRSRLAGARQTRARVRRAAAVPAAGAARRSDL